MDERDKLNRRDFLQTAGAAGTATALAGAALTPAQAAEAQPPAGFVDQKHFKLNWTKQLSDVVKVDPPPELTDEAVKEAVKERHRIYCFLLMKLIHRFWNGNKNGPLGTYPMRTKQLERAPRYRGDMIDKPDGFRVNWDRYLGHNIACVAVDGNGEIIDFDFNHNNVFRSSAEHAESRMVRRLFSLTHIFDNWKTKKDPDQDKAGPALLSDVTLYTSLESCAQCSGVMSLGGVKQIIYLQNDFTAYMIGNIMFNLAKDNHDAPHAPIPIAGSEVGLPEFSLLNEANLRFAEKLTNADKTKPEQAFFVSEDGNFKDFEPSITSFLCTDEAYDIFAAGGAKLDTVKLNFGDRRFPNPSDEKKRERVLTNDECLKHAQDFYKYADIEGYRGSPHKL